jgi:predicted ester cyclase
MSTGVNKELVRRYYEEIVSEVRIDDLPSFISSDYVEVYRGQRHASGLEGAKRHILGVHETYRGLRIVVERQIAEGDWVVSQITARGTHVGPWMGMKPTGKVVEFTGVNVDKVVDGRIVEHGGAANMLEPLLAIGAIQVVG